MSFQESIFASREVMNRELLMRFEEVNPKYPESVMTTWEISLRYLERTQARASRNLRLLDFLDHSRLSESIESCHQGYHIEICPEA